MFADRHRESNQSLDRRCRAEVLRFKAKIKRPTARAFGIALYWRWRRRAWSRLDRGVATLGLPIRDSLCSD